MSIKGTKKTKLEYLLQAAQVRTSTLELIVKNINIGEANNTLSR
jgi:hypothetical protein